MATDIEKFGNEEEDIKKALKEGKNKKNKLVVDHLPTTKEDFKHVTPREIKSYETENVPAVSDEFSENMKERTSSLDADADDEGDNTKTLQEISEYMKRTSSNALKQMKELAESADDLYFPSFQNSPNPSFKGSGFFDHAEMGEEKSQDSLNDLDFDDERNRALTMNSVISIDN